MATAQWTGFIHSWHTLGVVLKWMCRSVVGIPFAILTCLLVALAAFVFFGLLLLAAFLSCVLVYYVFVGIYQVIARAIEFVTSSDQIQRELPVVEPCQPPFPTPPMQELRTGIFTIRTVSQAADRSQIFPNPFNTRGPRTPPQAHLGSLGFKSSPRPATNLPGTIFDCQVCLEGKNRSQFPIRQITDGCDHQPTDCCSACLSQSITSAFEGNMWDDIRCPICNVHLCHRDVAEFAAKEIFERQAIQY